MNFIEDKGNNCILLENNKGEQLMFFDRDNKEATNINFIINLLNSQKSEGSL